MNKLTKGSNLRWKSSRMMLPEHVQALRQDEADLGKKKRPSLDDQELETLNRTLSEALSGSKRVALRYYQNGYIKKSICCVEKLDTARRQLKICDVHGLGSCISLMDIVEIKLADPAADPFSGM